MIRRAWIAVALSAAACVVPQEIVADDSESSGNRPPVMDPTTDASPAGALVCASSLDAAPTEFRLDNLRDDDGTPLEARWFIDYDGGFTAIQKTETLVRAASASVYPPTTFSSNDIDPFHRAQGKPFSVEVVVSDGFDGADLAPRQRAVRSGRYSVSYRWSVLYRTGALCE